MEQVVLLLRPKSGGGGQLPTCPIVQTALYTKGLKAPRHARMNGVFKENDLICRNMISIAVEDQK